MTKMADNSTSTGVLDELERAIPGAYRDRAGVLVLDGDAVTEAARRIDADGVVGRGDLPRRAFGVPEREAFVDPVYLKRGGNAKSEYAPLVDFIPAPTVADVARRIVAKYPAKFPQLLPPIDQQVDYLWKRTGGASAGKSVLGKCVRAGSLARYYLTAAMPEATWVIWVAADNCFGITPHQLEALVLHELLHTGMTDKLKPKIRPHDVEEFRFVIEEYGFWDDDLRALRESVRQRSLFEGGEDDDAGSA